MEILSTEVISEFTLLGGLLASIAVVSGVFGVISLLYGILDESKDALLFALVLIAASIATGVGADSDGMSTEHEQYKVVVADLDKEFLDQYEIVEQDGKILTIEEKGDE